MAADNTGIDRQVPISRRSAISTGTLTAIGVGLAAAAQTAAPVAAQPAEAAPVMPIVPADALVAALCREPKPETDASFAEWLEAWRRDYAAARAAHQEAYAALEAYVPADRRYELVGKLSDTEGDVSHLEMQHTREIFFRHLPGLEPVLRLLWAHASDTHFGRELECPRDGCKDGC